MSSFVSPYQTICLIVADGGDDWIDDASFG